MPKKSIARAIFYFSMVLIQNMSVFIVTGRSLIRDHPNLKVVIISAGLFFFIVVVSRMYQDIKRLAESKYGEITKNINEILSKEFWPSSSAGEPITSYFRLELHPKQMYPIFFFSPKDLIVQGEDKEVRISGVLYNTRKIYKDHMSSQGYKS